MRRVCLRPLLRRATFSGTTHVGATLLERTNKNPWLDYARHMGFVVFPARPNTPRHKPAIESSIGVAQRQFFAENRNQVFYSLEDLNASFKIYNKRLNNEVMKDYGVSRSDHFESEKLALKSLPENVFEVVIYKTAKVHTDCHIEGTLRNEREALPSK